MSKFKSLIGLTFWNNEVSCSGKGQTITFKCQMMVFKGQILVYKPHTLLDLHYHLTSNLQSFNIMPGKDTFHVNKKYLKNANYSLALGNDTYVASFQERILIQARLKYL